MARRFAPRARLSAVPRKPTTRASASPTDAKRRAHAREARAHRSRRDRLIEIEVAHRLRDRLFLRLAQRLFEPLRERVAARLFGVHRLLEDRLAARRLFREDPLRLAQLRLVAALRFLVPRNPPEVGVEKERGLTARARQLEFRFQLRHHFFPPRAPASPPAWNCFLISIGLPSGAFATSFRSVICMRRKLNRCPKPATNASSGTWNRPPGGISCVVTR